jgi:hypothetical protein
MLTFKKTNHLVAKLEKDKKDKQIFIKESFDDKDKAEIDTSEETKLDIFNEYLDNLAVPLSKKEKMDLIDRYKSGDDNIDNGKMYKIFTKGLEFVNDSLKKYLNFKDKILFPVVDRKFWCMYITGMGGSGKSYFISEFIYQNRKNIPKEAGIFLISPFNNDESYKRISKNIIYVDPVKYHEENGEDFSIDSIPKGSVIIWDDIESMKENKYIEKLRDEMLGIYRHNDLKLFCVSHIALGSKKTAKCILESQYFVVFKNNWAHSENLLSTYLRLSTTQLQLLQKQNTRWYFICKESPSYFVTEQSVGIF